MRQVPNFLSVVRVFIGFAFFFTFPSFLSKVLFYIALFTDLIDGYIARKFNFQSRAGEVLDPLADKTFFGLVLIKLYMAGILEQWFFYLVSIQYSVYVVIVALYLKKHFDFKANICGKITGTMIALVSFLAINNADPLYLNLACFVYVLSMSVSTYVYWKNFLTQKKAKLMVAKKHLYRDSKND